MCASNPARCSHLQHPPLLIPNARRVSLSQGINSAGSFITGALVDTVILLLLIAMASILKEMPEQQGALVPVAVVILVLMFLVVCLEFWTVNLWWKNNQGEGDAKIAFWTMFKNAYGFMKMHNVLVLFTSYLFTTISCVILMSTNITTLPSTYVPSDARRELKGGEVMASSDSAISGMYFLRGDETPGPCDPLAHVVDVHLHDDATCRLHGFQALFGEAQHLPSFRH